MPLGAHLTISKGLPEAAQLARAIGADTFGFHTRNPRGGARRLIPAEEIAAWQEQKAALGLSAPIGHLPYTINLGAQGSIWDFGVQVVAEDLQRCGAFGALAIVLHPGHAPEHDLAGGIARAAAGVRQAVAGAGSARPWLCLEAMAGQRGELGSTPEQLAAILAAAGDPDGVFVCLDTCHLFAAGWDIRTHTGIDQMLEAYDAAVGRARLRVLHLNDSRFPLGSHRDRHELLGRGEIGPSGMQAILTHPFLRQLPTIIETPVDDYKEYAGEIAAARRFAEEG